MIEIQKNEAFAAQKDFQYDVCIVGASVAGCAAAILYARQNLKVLLVDKKKTPDQYKKVCTTYIQKSAMPVVRELGIEKELLETDALPNACDIWTRYGWISGELPNPVENKDGHGLCVRRSDLDPLMLERASQQKNVDTLLNTVFLNIDDTPDEHSKIHLKTEHGEIAVLAKLLVGADGRHSKVAAAIDAPKKQIKNERFAKYAFYKNIDLRSNGKSLFWVLEPDTFFMYPYTRDETLVCGFFDREKLSRIREDTDGYFTSVMQSLPEGPNVSDAERTTDYTTAQGIHNIYRKPAHRGCALIGDAALAGDPMAGIGCGWAMQSAKLLVDSTAQSFENGVRLKKALKKYKWAHRRAFMGHFYFISDASSIRGLNAAEKLLMKAAVGDAAVTKLFHDFIAREISPMKAFSLRNLYKILKFNIKSTLQKSPESRPINEEHTYHA